MFERIAGKLTYANVMSTFAVLVTLTGGTALALSRGEVKTKHLAPGAVKPAKLAKGAVKPPKIANGAVKSNKLAPGSVNGEHIAEGQIGSDHIATRAIRLGHVDTSRAFFSGIASANIKNLGAAATRFGAPVGISEASPQFHEVATGSPGSTYTVSRLDVQLNEQLGAGQSRTFTVMRTASLAMGGLSCTINAGESSCQDFDSIGQTNFTGDLAIRIQSSGAGLNANQSARVGFAVVTTAPFTDH